MAVLQSSQHRWEKAKWKGRRKSGSPDKVHRDRLRRLVLQEGLGLLIRTQLLGSGTDGWSVPGSLTCPQLPRNGSLVPCWHQGVEANARLERYMLIMGQLGEFRL